MMMQEAVGIRDRQLSGQYSKEQLQERSSMNTNGDREQEQQALKCPRCDSPNTKFCYYNNYNLTQPRHFCKTCRRYWTKGGALRNVPIGGGCRKNKKTKQRSKDQNPLSPIDHDTSSLNVSNGLSLLHNLWPTPAAASTFLDLPSPDRFVNLSFAKLQNHSSLMLGTLSNNTDPNTISSNSSTVSIMSMFQQQQELSMKGNNIEDPSGGHMMNVFRNPGSHIMAPPSSSIEPGTCSMNFGVESLSINNSTGLDNWAWRLQEQQRLGMGMVVANQPQNTGMDPIPDHLILGDQRFQHHYMKGKTAAVCNDLVHTQPYDIRPLSEWQNMADSLLEVTPTPTSAPAIGESSSSYWHDLQTM